MLYDLSWVLPVFVVIAVLALLGSAVSVTVMGRTLARHHRIRRARRQSIPAYYRRVVTAH